MVNIKTVKIFIPFVFKKKINKNIIKFKIKKISIISIFGITSTLIPKWFFNFRSAFVNRKSIKIR